MKRTTKHNRNKYSIEMQLFPSESKVLWKTTSLRTLAKPVITNELGKVCLCFEHRKSHLPWFSVTKHHIQSFFKLIQSWLHRERPACNMPITSYRIPSVLSVPSVTPSRSMTLLLARLGNLRPCFTNGDLKHQWEMRFLPQSQTS